MSPFDLTKTLTFGALAMVLSTSLASAQCPAADANEPDDDCLTATAVVSPYSQAGLTVFGEGNLAGQNLDFFSINLPAGEILQGDLTFSTANGDIDLYFYDAAAAATCGGTNLGDYLVRGFTGSDNESIIWANTGAAAMSIVVMVDTFGGGFDCNDYSIDLATFADPCVNPTDDIFEPNDSCGAGVALPAGITLNLFASDVNEDYYQIAVPVAAILTVDLTYSPAGGDVDMLLYSDNTCATLLDSDFTFGGTGQVSWSNATGVAQLITLRCTIAAGEDCNTYELNVAVPPDPCLQGIDDSHEPNDTCATAGALGAGAELGLFVSDTNPDNYTISVPVGEILTVDMTYVSGVNADPDMVLYDDAGTCLSQVDTAFSFGGASQVEWSNATGVVATITLNVNVLAGEGCNTYDLNVSTAPDPCLDPASEDSFSPNHDCASAYAIGDGTYPGLFITPTVLDFFSVTLADTDTLTVDMISGSADLDIYLWDDAGVNCGSTANYLARAFSGGNTDTVSWTNMSGASMSITIGMDWFSGPDCDNYDLTITGAGGSFATPFCFGDGSAVACPCANESAVGAGEGCAWSGGVGAILTATGSNSVAADDIQFHVSQARASQPSMLVQGATLIAVPFKDGILCMGNPTERVEVVFLDGNGEGSSLSSIITEGNVSPGDTRHYQQWFRDPGGISPCGTGSNFTQGLTVNYI